MDYISSYVRAVFSVFHADGTDSLVEILGDINALFSLANSRDFFSFLASPIVSVDEKCSFLLSVESMLDRRLLNFLCILVANGRGSSIIRVLKQFVSFTKARIGMVDVIISSSEELPASKTKKIVALLTSAYPLVGNIKNKVNPSLLGGLVIVVGGRILDFSIKSRLTNFLSVSRDPLVEILGKC